jgi:Ca2+-binding EF-hand superfamily protein
MLMNDECDFCTPLNACALHHCVHDEMVALRRAFDMIDTDGNGTLDAGEISQALTRLGTPITIAQAEKMCLAACGDEMGEVTFAQFKQLQLGKSSLSSSRFVRGWIRLGIAAPRQSINLSKARTLSATEVASYKTAFAAIDTDGSGAIDPFEMLHAVRAAGLAETTIRDIHVLFGRVDSDGDGVIDLEEFIESMRHIDPWAIGSNARRERKLFSFFGAVNANGSPSTPTFRLGPRRKLSAAEVASFTASFEALDLDGSGTVDKEEMLQAVCSVGLSHVTAADIAALFAMVDVDGDGELNVDEFIDGMRQIELLGDRGQEMKEGGPLARYLGGLRAVTNGRCWWRPPWIAVRESADAPTADPPANPPIPAAGGSGDVSASAGTLAPIAVSPTTRERSSLLTPIAASTTAATTGDVVTPRTLADTQHVVGEGGAARQQQPPQSRPCRPLRLGSIEGLGTEELDRGESHNNRTSLLEPEQPRGPDIIAAWPSSSGAANGATQRDVVTPLLTRLTDMAGTHNAFLGGSGVAWQQPPQLQSSSLRHLRVENIDGLETSTCTAIEDGSTTMDSWCIASLSITDTSP